MLRVDRLASNTAMAVTIDTGDAIELHPKNKKPIGLRHAYLALKQTYGQKFPAKGPVFERQTIKESNSSEVFRNWKGSDDR